MSTLTYLMNSLEERSLLNALILRYVLRSSLKSIRLLVRNSTLTLDGHSSRLRERHAEDVIGLHATADTTVAGNGSTKRSRAVRILLGSAHGLADELSGDLAIFAFLGTGESIRLINLKSKL